jgi:peptide/nickel transport system permease protein
MMRRLAQRLAWSVFVVWAVASLTFAINNLLPGDPARMVAGPQAREKDVARVRADLGLDRPIAAQYGIFMRRLLHLGARAIDRKKDKEHATCASLGLGVHVDLGKSYTLQRPVVDVLEERIPRTFALALAAVFIQVAAGVLAGLVAARKRGRALDHATVGATLIGVSAPTFLIGIALQFVFAHELRWLPLDGFGTTLREHALGLVLPAFTLGIFGAAYYTRLVRDEMIDLMKADHVRTARAKGMGEGAVVVKHALRNALVPLVTVVALDIGVLMGGAAVTETIFRWPGLGQLSVNALLARDGPVILGAVLVTSVAIVVCNLLADVAYATLDPRVRR